MRNKMLLAVIMSVVLVPSAYAIYLANMSFTGSVTVAQGSQPSSQIFVWDIDMLADATDSQQFIYDNTDGQQDFNFTIDTSGISSTAGNCIFKDGIDLVFNLSINGDSAILFHGAGEALSVSSGSQTVTIETTSHANTCPLTGSVSLSGILV